MLLRNVRRIRWRRRSTLGAVLALALMATAAGAATTWTVIVGTSGNDTINKGGVAGNFRIWGLAGKDALTGGKGNNVLVGDGKCPAGATTDDYCQIQTVPGDGGDTLRGGGGNNWIYGGGGPNTLYGGQGSNYIQSGPSTNVIYGGPVGDAINATSGSSTIYPGRGTNYVDTRGPGIDHVYCSGKSDTVFADRNDVIVKCAHVYYGSASASRWDQLLPGVRPKARAHKARAHGRRHHRAHRSTHRGHSHGRR